MTSTRAELPLIWITDRLAVNLSNVTSVFYGKGGQLVVGLVSGESIQVLEELLTTAGKETLLSGRDPGSTMRGPLAAGVTPSGEPSFDVRA